MQQPRKKFSIGDLVEYSDNLPFAMHSSSVGVVVEILNLKEEWRKLEEDTNPEYAKGFLEELKMFHALKGVEKKPDQYPQQRQEMLEKMLRKGMSVEDMEIKDEDYLVRVVWTSGESYVEHPADLDIVLKVKEVPDGER